MKSVKQIEEQGYWSINDLRVYLIHWRNWVKSGIGDVPHQMPEIVDSAIDALDRLQQILVTQIPAKGTNGARNTTPKEG